MRWRIPHELLKALKIFCGGLAVPGLHLHEDATNLLLTASDAEAGRPMESSLRSSCIDSFYCRSRIFHSQQQRAMRTCCQFLPLQLYSAFHPCVFLAAESAENLIFFIFGHEGPHLRKSMVTRMQYLPIPSAAWILLIFFEAAIMLEDPNFWCAASCSLY